MTRIYTEEDSREIRKTFFDAVKKQKAAGIKDDRKILITKKEWDTFSKSGKDMSRYEVWKDFESRMRKEDALRRKHLNSIMSGK